MKDYSIKLEERKDFILGYDVTKDGQIKIKFAKGKPWYIPYNQENERKILDKMEGQLKNSATYEENLTKKVVNNRLMTYISGGLAIVSTAMTIGATTNLSTYTLIGMASVCASIGLVSGVNAIKNYVKLKDLRKNTQFLEMQDKLNQLVRKNENTLVDVSAKTKNVVKDFPEDVQIFNINSFNFVPFKDLEQIMENAARNEKFGFDYDTQEEVKGFTRKRVR